MSEFLSLRLIHKDELSTEASIVLFLCLLFLFYLADNVIASLFHPVLIPCLVIVTVFVARLFLLFVILFIILEMQMPFLLRYY